MSKFIINSTYSLLGKAFGMLFLFLLDIVIARILDVAGYAEWVYFFSILTMLFFIGWLGINASTKVLISKCNTAEEKKYCLTAGFCIRVFSSIIISIFLIAILYVLSGKLGYPDKYSSLRHLILFSGVLIFFNSFTEFYKEVFMAYENFKRLFQLTVLEYFGYLFFTIIFLKIFPNVKMMPFAYCTSGFLVFIFGMFVLLHECDLFKLETYDFSRIKSFAFKILKYAIPMLVVGMGAAVLIEIDTFMLGVLSSKNQVAVYNIAKTLISKAAHINYSLSVGCMTSFAVIRGSEFKFKSTQFKRYSLINFFVSLFISIVIVLFAPILIIFFYGKEYSLAGNVIRLLVFYYILYSSSVFYSLFMDFRNKANARAVLYVITIIIDIILNMLFIPEFGAIGASVATTVAFIPYMVFVLNVSRKEWKMLQLRGDS